MNKIFSNENIVNSELFVLDKSLLKELLASFEGAQVYSIENNKQEAFLEASEEMSSKGLPAGEFYLSHNVTDFGQTKATLVIDRGILTVLKGAKCAPITHEQNCPKVVQELRDKNVVNNVLAQDCVVPTPSAGSFLVVGKSTNGWTEWKDSAGKPLSDYKIDD